MLITSDDDLNTIWAPPPQPTARRRGQWLRDLAETAGRTAVFCALVAMVLMGAFSAGLGLALVSAAVLGRHHP